jgi:hypothetical protein
MSSSFTRSHVVSLHAEAASGRGVGHDLHDVNFRILDAEGRLAGEIRAHKLVLCLVSDVFKAQFCGAFAEQNTQVDKNTYCTVYYIEDNEDQCCESGSGAFFTPGSEIREGKKSGSKVPESGMNISDHFSKSFETVFWLKIL